jgi:deoxyribodipyrimidine photo-lyase
MVGEDYSSKFSAWLALGCISPRIIYQEIKRYENENGANESTYMVGF